MKPNEATASSVAVSISPAQLKSKLDAGESIRLVDVRTRIEFAQVHATGATNVPIDELDPQELSRTTPAGTSVAVICKSGGRSTKACAKLASAGVKLLNVEGGTDAWVAAGLPVEKRSNVISLERQVRIFAGLMVLAGVAMGYTIHPRFFALSGAIGAGLVVAGVTNWCGAAMLLAKMPWNKVNPNATCCAK